MMRASSIPSHSERAETARQVTAERLVVKWADPTEEALGTAMLAGALVDRRIAHPGQMALVAPNRIWALNLQRACESRKVAASLCIPQPGAIGEDDRAALAAGEADRLRGASLVRRLGWDARPELAHALLHLQGDEGPERLLAIVEEQCARPTLPAHPQHIPIRLLESEVPETDYLFVVGCVDGLVPAGEPDAPRRAAFAAAIAAGRRRSTASYFSKAPLQLAEQARLRFSRIKVENGASMAMVKPSPYLAEAGIWRPSTTGGQALLRKYGLN